MTTFPFEKGYDSTKTKLNTNLPCKHGCRPLLSGTSPAPFLAAIGQRELSALKSVMRRRSTDTDVARHQRLLDAALTSGAGKHGVSPRQDLVLCERSLKDERDSAILQAIRRHRRRHGLVSAHTRLLSPSFTLESERIRTQDTGCYDATKRIQISQWSSAFRACVFDPQNFTYNMDVCVLSRPE